MTMMIGDCREVMATMDAESVDAVVTDPPYDLTTIGRSFQGKGGTTRPDGGVRSESRTTGFMGKAWDGTGVAFDPATWREAFRVLKPGAHLLAFGGTRTVHRMVCAIEDAGFEIRDSIVWMYGSGFPKSLNVGEGRGTALKPAHEPIVVARKPLIGTVAANAERYGTGALNIDASRIGYKSNDPRLEWQEKYGGKTYADAAKNQVYGEYQSRTSAGHSSGRWPANVILTHSPDCREVGTKRVKGAGNGSTRGGRSSTENYRMHHETGQPIGYADADGMETVSVWECARDPETGSYLCPVALLDEQSGERKASKGGTVRDGIGVLKYSGTNSRPQHADQGGSTVRPGYTDSGGSSRFFLNTSWQPGELDEATRFRYCAKASRRERNAGLEGMPEGRGPVMSQRCINCGKGRMDGRRFGPCCDTPEYESMPPRGLVANDHPTCKPVALMRYLVRLVTPPGGIVLDPFLGSGTTGMACALEGFDFIGIDQDAHYVNDIAAHRIAHVVKHGERWLDAAKAPDHTKRESGVYAGGKGRTAVARCPVHDQPQGRGLSRDYQCGCQLIRTDYTPRAEPRPIAPSADTPTVTNLPLFALVAD